MMWSETVLKDGLLGFVCGDALGVPVKYTDREILETHPITGMQGYGTYRQPPGTWSDETSLLLATMDSISRMGQIHLDDMMSRYLSWYDEKAYLAYGEVFDLSHITRNALENYRYGTAAFYSGGRSDFHNSNSAISRMLPVAFYMESRRFRQVYEDEAERESPDYLAIQLIHQVSCLTNGHYLALVCSGIYTYLARWLIRWRLEGGKPGALRSGDLIVQFERLIEGLKAFYTTTDQSLMQPPYGENGHVSQEEREGFREAWEQLERLDDLPAFLRTPVSEILSDGNCLHALESTLYCLLNTDSYEDAVLMAVNLGGDSDTNGALVGGLAGIIYGREQIPSAWLDTLAKRTEIEEHGDVATVTLYRPELSSIFMLIPWLESVGPNGLPASLPRDMFYPLGGAGEIYLDKDGTERACHHLVNTCTIQLTEEETSSVSGRLEYLRTWRAQRLDQGKTSFEVPAHLEIYHQNQARTNHEMRDWALAEFIFLLERGQLRKLLNPEHDQEKMHSDAPSRRMGYAGRLLDNLYLIRRLYARGLWFGETALPESSGLLHHAWSETGVRRSS